MPTNFSVQIAVNKKTGSVTAVYFQTRSGRSAKTKELADGMMLADYNAKGELIGLELLGPCTAEVLDKIVIDKPARLFIRKAAPRELVTM